MPACETSSNHSSALLIIVLAAALDVCIGVAAPCDDWLSFSKFQLKKKCIDSHAQLVL
jgi:hypothetical protein